MSALSTHNLHSAAATTAATTAGTAAAATSTQAIKRKVQELQPCSSQFKAACVSKQILLKLKKQYGPEYLGKLHQSFNQVSSVVDEQSTLISEITDIVEYKRKKSSTSSSAPKKKIKKASNPEC